MAEKKTQVIVDRNQPLTGNTVSFNTTSSTEIFKWIGSIVERSLIAINYFDFRRNNCRQLSGGRHLFRSKMHA